VLHLLEQSVGELPVADSHPDHEQRDLPGEIEGGPRSAGFGVGQGTEMRGPHWIPTDLLDRLVIIRTEIYSRREVIEILSIRAEVEGMETEEGSLEFLDR